MKFKWIVGGGRYLDEVFLTWRHACPDESIQKLEIPQYSDHSFDLRVLDDLDASDSELFVAFDERFGNFKRMELMSAVMDRGFKLTSFVHPSAVVGVETILGKNIFLGAGVVLGHGCRVDYNSVVHAGCIVGSGSHVKSSCWIESGVSVGNDAEIGAHSILRLGSSVRSKVKIGRGCELGWARCFDQNVPSKTVFDSRYDEPIHVYFS